MRSIVVVLCLVICGTCAIAQDTQRVEVTMQGTYNEVRKHVHYIEPITRTTYEDKVYGYSSYYSTTDSANVTTGAILTLFSNGKAIDGDTLCVDYKLLNGSQEAVIATHVRAGMNAAWGNGANERLLESPFEIPLDTLRTIETWEAHYYRCDKMPDKLVCAGIAAGTVLAGAPTEIMSVCGLSPADFLPN